MELTEDQKKSVAEWFAAGASLDEIQKRIKSEFGIHMTYLDVRLMVAELPPPKEPETPEKTDEPDAPDNPEPAEKPDNPENSEDAAPSVSVEVDALMIPGTLASGSVTFSDGTAGKWYLDRMGRLGLSELPEGYRPSQTDGVLFQQRLMEVLQSKGLM